MKPWRPSQHVVSLMTWVNLHYPHRDKASDGILGDQRHAARQSDHNPDPETGVVRACDIDADLDPTDKTRNPAYRLADTIRTWAKTGERPIAYVIYDGHIASQKRNWVWRPYDGPNPHQHHIHVSFRKAKGE